MFYRIWIIDADKLILKSLILDVDKEEDKDIENKDIENLLTISLISYL